jgi:hypothetical protein
LILAGVGFVQIHQGHANNTGCDIAHESTTIEPVFHGVLIRVHRKKPDLMTVGIWT